MKFLIWKLAFRHTFNFKNTGTDTYYKFLRTSYHSHRSLQVVVSTIVLLYDRLPFELVLVPTIVPHTLNCNFNCSHSRLMRSISPSCVEASRVALVQVRMLLLRVPAFILRNLEVPVPTWYLSQAFLRFHAVSALFAGKLERNINLQTTVTKTPEHQNTTDTTLKQP